MLLDRTHFRMLSVTLDLKCNRCVNVRYEIIGLQENLSIRNFYIETVLLSFITVIHLMNQLVFVETNP